MSQLGTGYSLPDVLDRPLAPWEDQTTTSWDDLKDPSIQMKPGGIGLGNLHRKGTNYKPLSEPATPTPPSSSSSMPAGTAETVKRNVLQTTAFKTAIAALGQKQKRVPSRDRSREEIAKGTGWGTSPLLKTPFWSDNNANETEQQQQQQQQLQPQPQPQPQYNQYHQEFQQLQPQQAPPQQQYQPQDNVLAVFDISFVDDSETGISIKQSHTFQSVEMTSGKSNDSSISFTQQVPTTSTSISSFASSNSPATISGSGLAGSNASIWASANDNQQQQQQETKEKTNNQSTKWNPKAQAFQFNFAQQGTTAGFGNSDSDGGSEKPVTPIFEFAKPSEEPEAPFFNFTNRDKKPVNDDVPLFNFSTALNISKVQNLNPVSGHQNNSNSKEEEEEEEEEEEGGAVYEGYEEYDYSSENNTSDFTFSFPIPKRVTITSPHSKKPNPEAPEFTPTPVISKAIPIKSPTTSVASIKSSTTTTTTTTTNWNPKVTEFVPTFINNNNNNNNNDNEQDDDENENINIPSFVVRPKSTKIEIKAPPPPSSTTSTKQETVETSVQGGDLQSQSQPETTRGLEEPIPILQITISFAPGVTSILSVFENDDPKKVVTNFCRKHDLTMKNKAQLSFIDTITKLKNAKMNSLSKSKII